MFARALNALPLFFLLLAASACFAVSPDPRLLELVPPGSPIVAGIHSSAEPGLPGNFLLVSQNNRIDMNDFLALTGADPSKIIREVIFVAADIRDPVKEHSLLASGVFGRSSIFKYADGVRASTQQYRGITVMVVPPFERERKYFSDVRWLAILDSNIAVFGTASSVQLELDRYVDHSRIDPVLGERLKQLNKKDDTWSLVGTPLPGRHLEKVFGKLDQDLGATLAAGGFFELGIEFGTNQVTFHYELVPASGPSATDGERSLDDGEQRPPAVMESAFTHPVQAEMAKPVRGSLRVSRDRYEAWLARLMTLNHSADTALAK
jgi:hypothetical protein